MASTTLEIRPVSGRADQKAFLNLAKKIYANDPNWIPPIWSVQEGLVGFKKHPFWEFSRGRALIAVQNGETVGRILAVVNDRHNERYNEKRGFFGFFECIDNQQVAHGLLDAAAAWLREQGMTDVRGPVNPSLNYEIGLLIEGFETPPTFMMTYNPPYYEALLTSWGLEKTQDAYAYDVDVNMLKDVDPKIINVVNQVQERFAVNTRPLDRKNLKVDINSFIHIYNQSLQNTWGYVPMSDQEVEHMARDLKMLIVPDLTSIAEVEGKPVGAGFALLDFNPIIKQIGGKLFPFGFLRILFGRKGIKRVRLISTNVLPEWQRWGLGLVLWMRVIPAAMDFGIREAELSWVLESNHLSRGTIERGGGKLKKTYRLYDRNLTA